MEYHAYRLAPSGHILARIEIFDETDGSALERARSVFPQSDVELWQGARRIGVFAGNAPQVVQPLSNEAR